MSKLRVMMVHTFGGGIGYSRFHIPARALKERGHDVQYNTHDGGWFAGQMLTNVPLDKWLEQNAPKYDLLHMGYTQNQSMAHIMNGVTRNYMLQAHGREWPVLVDMDDDPHSVPSYNTAFRAYVRSAAEKKNLLIHLHTADAVTTTREECAQALRRDSKHIYVLPNCVNPSDWINLPRDPRRREDKSVRMMFAGGHGHYGDLAIIKDTVTELMDKYDGTEGKPLLRLIFLGCTPDWASHWMRDRKSPSANRCFYIQPCRIRQYHEALRWVEPDIYLAPIEQNTFNASKSCLRAMDGAIAGGALVCSDWTTYEEVPEAVCLKAHTPFQWRESLEQLILDPSLRSRLASSLLGWTLDTRDIKQHIHKWEEAYADALTRPVIKSLEDVVRPAILTPEEALGGGS